MKTIIQVLHEAVIANSIEAQLIKQNIKYDTVLTKGDLQPIFRVQGLDGTYLLKHDNQRSFSIRMLNDSIWTSVLYTKLSDLKTNLDLAKLYDDV